MGNQIKNVMSLPFPRKRESSRLIEMENFKRLSCLPPVIDENSRVLILGTMPGVQSLAKQQYYANPGNQFWRLIYGVFNLPPAPDYVSRIKFIQSKGIALWDVLASCARTGSSDADIKDFEVNNFTRFFINYPRLRCVAFSSQKAFQIFDKRVRFYLRDEKPPAITPLLLPSPSGQYARMSFQSKLETWRIIRQYLLMVNGG